MPRLKAMRVQPVSAELIAATPDEELDQLLYQHVLALQAEAPEGLDTLSVAFQAHFIAVLMDNEINNGGFNQFWFNVPDFAADAASALEVLLMHAASALAARAAEAFETVRDRHETARRDGSIESFMATYENSPFKALDDEYYAHASDWEKARIFFIRNNVALFVHIE